MAYVGNVKDDTEKIPEREPLLLAEWANYTPMSYWSLRVAKTVALFVIQDIAVDEFIFTMAVARLELGERQVVYAAAGRPPALLVSPRLVTTT